MSEKVRYRRTWPQRGLLVGCATLVGASLYTASTVRDVYDDLASIPRIQFAPGVLTDPAEVDPGGPRNILLVGTTENDGIDEDDPLRHERTDAFLADTIMLLRVDPANGQAQVMSINRDTWVPSLARKINAAAQFGKEQALVNAVKELVDVPIDNVMVVNFAGFRYVVDQLGGVPVYFPYDARDESSFFAITAGCHKLTGEQALSYVRSRAYEQRIDGAFVPDLSYDYGRAERQRDFLVLVLERAIDRGARNLNVARGLLDSVTKNEALTIDASLTTQNLLDLAQAFADFSPENLQRTVLPTTEAKMRGEDALLLDESRLPPIRDIFLGKGNTVEPRHVAVQLVDARGKVTEPVKPGTALAQLGFKVTTRAAPSGAPEPRTIITYSADQQPGAALLRRYLGTEPVLQEVTGVGTLRATLGLDFTGVLAEPKPDPSTTPASTPTATGAAPTSAASGPAATVAPTTTAMPDAPTTTSGIYGRPPEGVDCR